MMCLSVSGCGSSDESSGASDGGYYTTAAYAGDSGGEAPAADEYYAAMPIVQDDNRYSNNSGVLSHADGNESGGKTVGGGLVGVEADVDEDLDGIVTTSWYNDDAWLEQYNTEEYNSTTENGFKSAANNPLSTFSIDVDTASYSNVRRMIEYGSNIDPNAVRVEEFINYFSYDYSEPTTDDPFSVTTELSDCPWNDDAKLLLVGLKAQDIDMSEREPLNLVFLIDVSGSMFSEDKLPLVQKSFTMLTESLGEDDRISIVTYAGEDKVVLKGTSGADKEKIIEAINSLEASGSTYGEAGINRAYELAEKYFIDGGNNRVILATDGDLNVGVSSQEELKKLIEKKRESGVFLSVLGFGTGNYKDARMEALADSGNGNYSYIDSELEAKKVLVEEMAGTLYTVAKDVKIQVEFNPANVKGYRLVGYENRALADRDFADDTKDAGEIGAGHTVTALYELILNDGSAYNPDLKYQQNDVEETQPVSFNNSEYSDELLTVSLRYKQPDGDSSKLLSVPVTKDVYTAKMPTNMTFAAAAAEFGMVLRNSAYKGSASCKQILDIVEDYNYRNDEYKSEFVYLVRTMDKRGY
ncbi:MAG: VWA domain-containing protein [Oscillospiraceae bacterium]|nr:VWA domain-containing protein [Oscillospiraceae bacterium]